MKENELRHSFLDHQAKHGFQVIDLIISNLFDAIQAAKNSTEFYAENFTKTLNFTETLVVEKPVKISVKSAEFILECLQKYKKTVDRGK